MELSQQVVNLQLSKRLEELEIKRDSYFYWRLSSYSKEASAHPYFISKNREECPGDEFYPAYTVAELGEILPARISINKRDYYISMDCDKHVYYERYEDEIYPDNLNHDEETEANARAKMLIYLIENGYVKVEDLNNV